MLSESGSTQSRNLAVKPVLVALALTCASWAPAQSLRIVNAASLASGSVAPGSIITIFGTNLGASVASATDVQKPPVSLGGASVTIGGVAAALFYVSPSQINAVVDSKTPLGADTVMVTSGAAKQTGTVTIDANAAPGLFSLFGTGTRDGAIVNAISFLLGDFSVQTANSPTFLALFATGLNLSVKPIVTIGGVAVDVPFFGAAPCCDGLDQINVMLPASLAGAGRVPVVIMQNGVASNVVQIVLLPPPNQTEFPSDQDNTTRDREIANVASIPGTSLVLVADQNDDVVRVVDVKAKQVTKVIVLAEGSNPDAIAVTPNGLTAIVTESGTGKAAVIDLTKFMVTTEIGTDSGPVRVAISGSQAIVVNTDSGTVSIINLSNDTVVKTVTVGHGPEGVAVDAAGDRAFVLDEDDGAISVIDLAGLTVINTIVLGGSLRPDSIALTGTGFAIITLPSAGPAGEVIILNLTTGAQTMTNVNPANSGGATDVVFFNGKLYFANQAGHSISVFSFSNGALTPVTTIGVDLGPRALTIDAKDNLLVVSHEGSGTLALIDLNTNTVVGHINVATMNGSDTDDHSDRDNGTNKPAVQSVTPSSSKAGMTLTITMSGSGLTGTSSVVFDVPPGNGDQGNNGNDKNKSDSAFKVSNIAVNGAGTQLTATLTIGSGAESGQHVVRVLTPNGESSGKVAAGDTFTVSP
jgi:uncharacterized protein (TIGR03437 family)